MKNRLSQAELYIKFMIVYGFNYLVPGITELAMYYQFLGNTFTSPGTVKNLVSGARAWVQLNQGDTTNFSAQELGMISKRIVEGSGHIPSPAAPVMPKDIRTICYYIDATPNPPFDLPRLGDMENLMYCWYTQLRTSGFARSQPGEYIMKSFGPPCLDQLSC